jgi:hypothetical protein
MSQLAQIANAIAILVCVLGARLGVESGPAPRYRVGVRVRCVAPAG